MNSMSIRCEKRRPAAGACMALFAVASSLAFVEQALALCGDTIPLNIPLNDLGPSYYVVDGINYQGGLYPNGLNQRPEPYNTIGINLATTQVVPRDPDGVPADSGLIGMVSIGMCNALLEFGGDADAFIPRANPTADNSVNPKVKFANCAQAGADAPKWTDPNSPTWTTALNKVGAAGLDPDQVQVVWLKEAWIFDCGNPPQHCTPPNMVGFPDHATGLQTDLKAILLAIKQKFPQIQIVYLSPRTRAYTITFHNPEPKAYETGFAVKWAIQDVISNQGGPVAYPWTCWGPYLWTNGNEVVSGDIRGRSDGLTWLCGDEGPGNPNDVRHMVQGGTDPDYVHPANHLQGTGVKKVTDQLIAFLKTDPTATPWFLKTNNPNQTPPTATPSCSPCSGPAGVSVQFHANDSDPDGTVVQRLWTFDDGDYSWSRDPVKLFPAPGNYNVHLTVIDNDGNHFFRSKLITVTQ